MWLPPAGATLPLTGANTQWAPRFGAEHEPTQSARTGSAFWPILLLSPTILAGSTGGAENLVVASVYPRPDGLSGAGWLQAALAPPPTFDPSGVPWPPFGLRTLARARALRFSENLPPWIPVPRWDPRVIPETLGGRTAGRDRTPRFGGPPAPFIPVPRWDPGVAPGILGERTTPRTRDTRPTVSLPLLVPVPLPSAATIPYSIPGERTRGLGRALTAADVLALVVPPAAPPAGYPEILPGLLDGRALRAGRKVYAEGWVLPLVVVPTLVWDARLVLPVAGEWTGLRDAAPRGSDPQANPEPPAAQYTPLGDLAVVGTRVLAVTALFGLDGGAVSVIPAAAYPPAFVEALTPPRDRSLFPGEAPPRLQVPDSVTTVNPEVVGGWLLFPKRPYDNRWLISAETGWIFTNLPLPSPTRRTAFGYRVPGARYAIRVFYSR